MHSRVRSALILFTLLFGAVPALAQQDVDMPRDVRVLVQKGLNSLGFDAGPADGLFGRKTRAAIWDWQDAKGLDSSGYLSQEEAEALAAAGADAGKEVERPAYERIGKATPEHREANEKTKVETAFKRIQTFINQHAGGYQECGGRTEYTSEVFENKIILIETYRPGTKCDRYCARGHCFSKIKYELEFDFSEKRISDGSPDYIFHGCENNDKSCSFPIGLLGGYETILESRGYGEQDRKIGQKSKIKYSFIDFWGKDSKKNADDLHKALHQARTILLDIEKRNRSNFDSTGNQSDWFTCSAGTTCVEYKIDDPIDRRNLMGQCRNPLEGQKCTTRRGCLHKAPGKISVTYDTYVDPDKFRNICKQNRGTMHTRR